MEPQRAPMPLMFEPGHIRVRRDPLGVTLIIGAWNEPFMRTFGPLTATLAAGNTAVVKPSEIAATCAAAPVRLAPKYFDSRAVAVVEGGVPETTALLEQQWEFIFFTGSPAIGKIVHRAAAKHLTPCVLELGGKNPTIVHPSADLKVAARRIANGRFMNSGHICTAPDHVLVWPEVKDEFVRLLVETIGEFGRVINRKNFDRLVGLLTSGKIVAGGQSDPADLYIAPTVIVDVSPDSPYHAGGSVRPYPAGARDRFSRSGDQLGQPTAQPARPVCVCGSQ
jgi:aldehyde dehydrogenase (NAD+)